MEFLGPPGMERTYSEHSNSVYQSRKFILLVLVSTLDRAFIAIRSGAIDDGVMKRLSSKNEKNYGGSFTD
jgi:hypothetical protein